MTKSKRLNLCIPDPHQKPHLRALHLIFASMSHHPSSIIVLKSWFEFHSRKCKKRDAQQLRGCSWTLRGTLHQSVPISWLAMKDCKLIVLRQFRAICSWSSRMGERGWRHLSMQQRHRDFLWSGVQGLSGNDQWVDSRTLLKSLWGSHVKLYSLLEDPAMHVELWSCVCSNKWATDPAKIVKFSKKKNMIPAVADKYLNQIVDVEMPQGLKQYLELELFPCVQQKVGKVRGCHSKQHNNSCKKKASIMLSTRNDYITMGMNNLMWWPTENKFILQIGTYHRCIMEYQPDNLEKEVIKTLDNFVECCLVCNWPRKLTCQYALLSCWTGRLWLISVICDS